MLRGGIAQVLVLVVVMVAPVRAGADDDFLAGLSSIVTREVRKQVKAKSVPFDVGLVRGELRAIEPEQHLQAQVTAFELAGDVLTATIAASGRFQVDAQIDRQTDISAEFDVKCTVAADVRFIKEGDKFFVEPTIKDMDLGLTVLEVSRAELQGGEELWAGLVVAAFKKNKQRVIGELNKQIGKRPF